ncbi:MAG: hypothetical protein FWC78_06485 [Defluviitaleaceae bacterium]|nr:hypothetical protein [Defluviitaleaceae bacterium]
MPKAKYQLEDFLAIVNEDCKEFVSTVHEKMLGGKYKPKIQTMKSTGLQLSYAEPKVKGVMGIILIFFMRENKLTIRIYTKNHKKYPHVLNGLPQTIVTQIENAPDCVKFSDPEKCWKGCVGYDFNIQGKQYQKCYVACFQLIVDTESNPYFLELIEHEVDARRMT